MRDRFTVVGRATGCHLFEGDGTRPIDEENVHVKYTPKRVQFPEEIAAWRRSIEAEEERKEASGLPHRWNNARFAVERVVVTRTHLAEEPVVSLALRDADYFDFLTTSLNLDRRQKNGLTLREQYLEGSDPADAPSWMNCSFGVNVAWRPAGTARCCSPGAVPRSRGRTAHGGTPPPTRVWPSSTTCPGTQSGQSARGGAPRHLRGTRRARRGQDQGGTARIRARPGQPPVGCVLPRGGPELDEPALRLRWTRGVTDKWEHDRFEFVDADPESVFGFIANEPEERWTPCAPALFYLALVRGAVERAGGDPAGRFSVEQAEQRVMSARGL